MFSARGAAAGTAGRRSSGLGQVLEKKSWARDLLRGVEVVDVLRQPAENPLMSVQKLLCRDVHPPRNEIG